MLAMFSGRLSHASIAVLIGRLLSCHATAYEPPTQVTIEAIISASNEVLARADMTVLGDNGYVEDIISLKGAGQQRDMGSSV